MVCSVDCAMNLQKGKMDVTATWKHKDWLQKLQADINHLVRVIDNEHDCISQKTAWEDNMMDAGHFYSRGGSPVIRFHLLNIWAQSKYANNHLGGDYGNFRMNLVDLYGEDKVAIIDELKVSEVSRKWVIPELKDARDITRTAVRDLKKYKAKFSIEDRWNLRVELNEIIGLYE